MITKKDKNEIRKGRHNRLRVHLKGTAERPRLNVYRSLNNIYAQVIDDGKGMTLASASTLDKEVQTKLEGKNKKEAAHIVGQVLGERAKKVGITAVVFDRGGYRYTGRVEELARGARDAGLDF